MYRLISIKLKYILSWNRASSSCPSSLLILGPSFPAFLSEQCHYIMITNTLAALHYCSMSSSKVSCRFKAMLNFPQKYFAQSSVPNSTYFQMLGHSVQSQGSCKHILSRTGWPHCTLSTRIYLDIVRHALHILCIYYAYMHYMQVGLSEAALHCH